ncbi:uncharacterized protein LOC119636121 [Glossina fuscipes]|uniref:Uncharacterized protein LOC119636121 n=1 Tax=Glossina fuscipes TaxID=7396 RepID=A0A8U0WNC5_9MUSC|nr:uncharacterized protein LOC119636121 [Glossina fuscipes]KAI9582665.1 hypothetical protein GQX74_011882 [Glossina fuscipes]
MSQQQQQQAPLYNHDLNYRQHYISVCKVFELLNNGCTPMSCHPISERQIDILKNLPKYELRMAYKFMYNNEQLFKKFFPLFCFYFGIQGDRNKLLTMADNLNRYPDHLVFLFDLHAGLMKTGLNKMNACRYILTRSCKNLTDELFMQFLAIFEGNLSTEM